MYYLESGADSSARMRKALLAACVIHVALAAAISFEFTATDGFQRQIEVTLATRPSELAPEEARHIAASDQLGSGDQAPEASVTSQRNDLPLESPVPAQSAPVLQESDARRADELLSTAAAAPRMVNREDAQRDPQRDIEGLDPDSEARNQQLASLQAQLDEHTRALSDSPRVRRLTSVSAKRAADAAYLADWLARLEAVGNKYYPEASIRYGIYGDVRLLVVIRKDGSLEDIRVLESSGYAVLDEAAIKVVRMTAPYAPFPAELAATTDKLEIVRTWHFQEN